MADQPALSAKRERAYRAVGETVHGRLALFGCALWTLSVAVVCLVSSEARRDMNGMLAAIVLLAPAGLVWLARASRRACEVRRPAPRRAAMGRSRALHAA